MYDVLNFLNFLYLLQITQQHNTINTIDFFNLNLFSHENISVLFTFLFYDSFC